MNLISLAKRRVKKTFDMGVQCVIRKQIAKEPDAKKNNNNQRKCV